MADVIQVEDEVLLELEVGVGPLLDEFAESLVGTLGFSVAEPLVSQAIAEAKQAITRPRDSEADPDETG